jgi:hypothetical protein
MKLTKSDKTDKNADSIFFFNSAWDNNPYILC